MLMLDLLTNTWQHPGSLKEKPWWLRLRQHWLKSDQVFYLRIVWYPKVIYLVPQMLLKYTVITKLNLGHVNKFEIKLERISLRAVPKGRGAGDFPWLQEVWAPATLIQNENIGMRKMHQITKLWIKKQTVQ